MVATKKETRHHASLYFGGTDGNRTSDTRIFSPLLYQLSYGTSALTSLKLAVCGCKNTTFFIYGNKKTPKRTFFLFLKFFYVDYQ